MNALNAIGANSRTPQAQAHWEEAALERHFGLEPIQPAAMFDLVSDCRKGGSAELTRSPASLLAARGLF